jgi:hypothetical protein
MGEVPNSTASVGNVSNLFKEQDIVFMGRAESKRMKGL